MQTFEFECGFMGDSDVILLWAEAEQEACKVCKDEFVNPSKLLSLAKRIESYSEVPMSLLGYCKLWHGMYGPKTQRISQLDDAAKIWSNLASAFGVSVHDKAWWNHCALVSILFKESNKYRFGNIPQFGLLKKTIESLKWAISSKDISKDITVQLTFGLFLVEFQVLSHCHILDAQHSLEKISRLDNNKLSLSIELKAVGHLLKKNSDMVKSERLFLEAANHHVLFMHIFRCLTLAKLARNVEVLK